MQKFYRLSAASLIVSLVLLTAPPARAGHVIAAAGAAGLVTLPVALTNTGDVFQVVPLGTWTLIGSRPGAFGFSFFDTNLWLLSSDGLGSLLRSLVSDGALGLPEAFGNGICSSSPIRSFTITGVGGFFNLTSIHEDGTICHAGTPLPGPTEPVAVEETTWGAVKDTYKFKD